MWQICGWILEGIIECVILIVNLIVNIIQWILDICWSIFEWIEDEFRYLKLYRYLRGGIWYHYKLGKDTPWIKLFTHWTKNKFSDEADVILLETEDYSRRGDIMLPQVLVARVGWMVVGGLITMAGTSDLAKEATTMFKEGVTGLLKDYEKDLAKNKQTVKDIKEGRQ